VPDMPVGLQTGVASDWLTMLGGYPQHAVEQACMDWIAGSVSRRPTPGEIKAACDRIVGKAKRERERLRALANLPVAAAMEPKREDIPDGPRELTEDQAAMLERVKRQLATAKPRTMAQTPGGDDRGQPRHAGRATEILTGFQMPDENDPAVQRTLRDMGTAEGRRGQ
jgi:hypothetical protein